MCPYLSTTNNKPLAIHIKNETWNGILVLTPVKAIKDRNPSEKRSEAGLASHLRWCQASDILSARRTSTSEQTSYIVIASIKGISRSNRFPLIPRSAGWALTLSYRTSCAICTGWLVKVIKGRLSWRGMTTNKDAAPVKGCLHGLHFSINKGNSKQLG